VSLDLDELISGLIDIVYFCERSCDWLHAPAATGGTAEMFHKSGNFYYGKISPSGKKI